MIGRWMAVAGALTALSAPPAVQAQALTKPAKAGGESGRGDCVYITQLQNSRPLGDRSVIFRANVSDFYRLDFAQRCEELAYPEPVVIMTPYAGIGIICHALDVNVTVREQGPGAIGEPCIPSRWRKLTPADVAAIPKKELP